MIGRLLKLLRDEIVAKWLCFTIGHDEMFFTRGGRFAAVCWRCGKQTHG